MMRQGRAARHRRRLSSRGWLPGRPETTVFAARKETLTAGVFANYRRLSGQL